MPVLSWLRRPALGHETEQMLHGVFVGPAFLFRKLAGTLVELRRHLRTLVRWTAGAFQSLGEQFEIHVLREVRRFNPT